MAENFIKGVPLKTPCVISGYWPVKGEINVLPLLETLRTHGHTCVLPHVVDKLTPLIFYKWDSKTPMIQGAYGIQEPDPKASSIIIPDIILVPLLAFDTDGHRLGYGGGHYDRTIEYLKAMRKITVVGISFAYQQFDTVPIESHDHTMDYIVTERNVFKMERN